MTNKVIRLGSGYKRRGGTKQYGGALILSLASLQHILIAVDRRGYTLKADTRVPNFFAVCEKGNTLVGTCRFSSDDQLVSYSLIDPSSGKYVDREIDPHARSAVALTSLFLDELARV